MSHEIALLDILQASRRIAPFVVRTPLIESRWLGEWTNSRAFLKVESLQRTGSFKLRGASNAAVALGAPRLVTASAGNHGLALAYAAERLGSSATIFVPRAAPAVKQAAIRRHGAALHADAETYEDAERAAKDHARATGAVYVSPYNDRLVIAGAGTVGLEIAEDLPDADVVVVPIGGGGLASGVAVALKSINPLTEVVAVEAAASPAFSTALARGRVTPIEARPTLADGLAGNMDPDTVTFELVRRLVDRIVLVGEDDLRAAMVQLAGAEHLIAEGAGAVGVAALLAGKVQAAGRRVAVIVSGGNVDWDVLYDVMRTAPPGFASRSLATPESRTPDPGSCL